MGSLRSLLVALSLVVMGAGCNNGEQPRQSVEHLRDPAQRIEVRITNPADRTAVPERLIVEGTVNDPDAAVWVVVHPMEVSNYWVQPPVTVRKDGTWRVQIYIGESGDRDVGKSFEIRAVAHPDAELKENDVLPGWPEAAGISDLVEVTRA